MSVPGRTSVADASPGVSAGAVFGVASSDRVNGTRSQAVGRNAALTVAVEPSWAVAATWVTASASQRVGSVMNGRAR